MLEYILTKGGIGGGPDNGGGIWTNEFPDELAWFVQKLRLCTKNFSTNGFTSLYGL